MISLLQVYRGFAAVLVVLYHTNGAVGRYFGDNRIINFFDFGGAGVQFFFVLSGFIIYYIHWKDIGKTTKAPTFLLKRVIRVYPTYIFITLLMIPFWLFVPGLGLPYHKELLAFISSILLLPQRHAPHLDVAWSLSHEMLFYFLFSFLIINRKLGRSIFFIWFGIIFTANIFWAKVLHFPLSFLFATNNMLFFFGMLAALLVIKYADKIKHGPLVLILSNIAFIGFGVWTNALRNAGQFAEAGSPMFVLLFGLASFGIVLQSSDSRIESFMNKRKLLLILGDASYSIYLIHYPIVSFLCKFIDHFNLHSFLPITYIFTITVMFAVACGVAVHYLFEKPSMNLLKGKIAATAKIAVA